MFKFITLFGLDEKMSMLICGAAGLLVVILIIILLNALVFSRIRYKKRIKQLRDKFNFLNGLLLGQDSQYIHRLEIISRTNLLYVEKYNTFQGRFKDIFDGDNKEVENMINQLDNYYKNKQFKAIKSVIGDVKEGLTNLETTINQLTSDLYAIIKPEEDARQEILGKKEDYRRVKQLFYANANNLELVAPSFNKVFEKLDKKFKDFDAHLESAEYDEASALIPEIGLVINAIEKVLGVIPNLCVIIETVVPGKIDALANEMSEVEKQGIPLFNLSFKKKSDTWKSKLKVCKTSLINLNIKGVAEELDLIQQEIEDVRLQIRKETIDKTSFEQKCDSLYAKATELEKTYIKMCNVMPDVEKFYILGEDKKEEFNKLHESIDSVTNSKRLFDSMLHSETKQPYSLLMARLENLNAVYEEGNKCLTEFKEYIEALKNNCNESYNMISKYFYLLKEIELKLNNLNVEEFSNKYKEKIDLGYSLLNGIDANLKNKPINVSLVVEDCEKMKNLVAEMNDDIDNKLKFASLAESAIVLTNRDRKHQQDVNQQLSVLEDRFFEGDFEKVYQDTTNIYRRMHYGDDK